MRTHKCVCAPLGDDRVLLAEGALPASTFAGAGVVWVPRAETYAAKYEPDPAKRADMVTFVTGHSMWEVVPQRAFAIIEREDEFAQRATRWVWG